MAITLREWCVDLLNDFTVDLLPEARRELKQLILNEDSVFENDVCKELEMRFPWLQSVDEEVGGADTVENLCAFYNAMGGVPVPSSPGKNDDEDVCRSCGEENDGDGFDGMCGNCADKAECKPCEGSGMIDGSTCTRCKGEGHFEDPQNQGDGEEVVPA